MLAVMKSYPLITDGKCDMYVCVRVCMCDRRKTGPPFDPALRQQHGIIEEYPHPPPSQKVFNAYWTSPFIDDLPFAASPWNLKVKVASPRQARNAPANVNAPRRYVHRKTLAASFQESGLPVEQHERDITYSICRH